MTNQKRSTTTAIALCLAIPNMRTTTGWNEHFEQDTYYRTTYASPVCAIMPNADRTTRNQTYQNIPKARKVSSRLGLRFKRDYHA